MAEVRKLKMKCPNCGEDLLIDVWESINMPYDEKEKEKILNNTFFHAECSKCGKLSNLAYRCEYNDIDRRYLILLVPGPVEELEKETAEYNNRIKNDKALQFARAGYTQRIVRDNNELREKVLIFDEDLDDRYIEIMKLEYYMELRKKLPKSSVVVGIYFDKNEDNKYQMIVIYNDRKPTVEEVSMDIYKEIEARMKDKVKKATPEGICRIYNGWASKILGK